MTLFRELADWKDGRLMSQNNHLVRAWTLVSFMDQRWGEVRKQSKSTPVFLPGESQGFGSLVGCRLWGRTESDMTEAT